MAERELTPRRPAPLSGRSPATARRARAVDRRCSSARALVSVVITAFIILTVLGRGDQFLTADRPLAAGRAGWFPRRGMFDIATLLIGTFLVTVIAMRHRGPGRPGCRRSTWPSTPAHGYAGIVKPVLEILAGIPSVVLGLLRAHLHQPEDRPDAVLERQRRSTWPRRRSASGILTIPLVASVSEDAMRAVPTSLREASYGLGARQASRPACASSFPAAVSGIVAALILGISRAIGETMVVAIAAGASGGSLTIEPVRPGPDDDGRDGRARHGLRPGRGQHARRSRACSSSASLLFLHDPRASTSSATGSSAARGSATEDRTMTAVTAPSPPSAVTGRSPATSRDIGGRPCSRCCCWSRCCSTLVVLVTLLVDQLIRGAAGVPGARDRLPDLAPVVRSRPRPASPRASSAVDPDRRPGRRSCASRSGSRRPIYLEEYAPANRLRGSSTSTSATSPACRRSSTACSA